MLAPLLSFLSHILCIELQTCKLYKWLKDYTKLMACVMNIQNICHVRWANQIGLSIKNK